MTGTLLALAACSGKSSRAPGQDASAGGGQAGSLGSGGAGGASGGSSAALSVDAALPADAVSASRADKACRDAVIAQCERINVCIPRQVSDCAQSAADRCPDYTFGPYTLRTVENVEACVPLLRQATCTDLQMGFDIATQCLLGGLGAAGDPCSGPAECASNMCSTLFGACGTCMPPLALGEACGGSDHCVSGTICHPTKRICVAVPLAVTHAAAGQPCDLTGDPLIGCEGDLVCVSASNSFGGPKCTPLPNQGEPCLTDSGLPSCAPGFSCGPSTASGRRQNLCGNPAPCGTSFCDANSFCYENPTGTYTCQPYVGASEACSQAEDSDRKCAPGFGCVVENAFSDGGRVYVGTCVPLRDQVDVGGACNHSSAICRNPLTCQAGRCVRFDPASCHERKDAAAGRG